VEEQLGKESGQSNPQKSVKNIGPLKPTIWKHILSSLYPYHETPTQKENQPPWPPKSKENGKGKKKIGPCISPSIRIFPALCQPSRQPVQFPKVRTVPKAEKKNQDQKEKKRNVTQKSHARP